MVTKCLQQEIPLGGEESLPVQLAARSGQGGVLGTRKVFVRAGVEIEKKGTTPGWLPRTRRDRDGSSQYSAQRKIHDRDATGQQACTKSPSSRGRKSPRASPDDDSDAVRPTAMQEDEVENKQSSAEPSGERNTDQPGFGQVVGGGRPNTPSICTRSEAIY